MQQKDFILRQIEILGQLLIALRNRILGREADGTEVSQELGSVVGRIGLDIELIRSATPDTLALMVAPTGDVDPGRCWLLAETLYLDGLCAVLEERREEALESLGKAARLFSMLEPGGVYLVGFPEANERIDEIRDRIQALETHQA